MRAGPALTGIRNALIGDPVKAEMKKEIEEFQRETARRLNAGLASFMRSIKIETHGFKELRRDMKAMGPDVLKEFKQILEDAGEVVARDAAALAPRRARPAR